MPKTRPQLAHGRMLFTWEAIDALLERASNDTARVTRMGANEETDEVVLRLDA
jgi:hypothetical protein